MATNLILIGFSGTGKSTIGRRVAERLGWRFVDLDASIAETIGKSVPEIFAVDGEPRFREIESARLREACAEEHAVIATGGGAVIAAANRRLMLERGFVVCLEAQPATLYARLQRQIAEDPAIAERPLLASEDPLARITALKERRQAFYAACHATVHVDSLSEEEAAEEVHRALARAGLAHSPRDAEGPVSVKTAGGHYQVHVGWGLLDRCGELVAARHPAARFFLVSDANVYARFGDRLATSLRPWGGLAGKMIVPAGEESKSLAQAERLWDWLVTSRVERGDVLLALGGGVVGDLAGFVAATYLRGIAYVQIPTSLLAMVDSSVGGKTAIDHAFGKNLIGAFHPPSLVVADIASLRGLSERQLRSGWAEIIKHGVITDEGLFERLETQAASLRNLDPGTMVPVVRLNVWLKARVVMADEREHGRRADLNYGHTIGHALEAVSDYALTHGEAVGIGMAGAARLAAELGMLSPEEADRQNRLLQAFGLATRAPAELRADSDAVLEAMKHDKKAQGSSLRWVLPVRIGEVRLARNVPEAMVRRVVEVLIRQ
ncbi:MAG: 3-dehydroquinate synthase [Dehalococcoidales bacterium]|nr:3-dehydroquinate synthase [Dehalococcoidales bacterium]